MNTRTASSVIAGLLMGLQVMAVSQQANAADAWPAFSSGQAGTELPAGWTREPFNDKKTPTDYDMVNSDGAVVLHAHAKSSVSFVMHENTMDITPHPIVHWRWKLGTLPTGADNSTSSKEDSAARLVFIFGGDRSKLPLRDRTVMATAQKLSGREMPYATLMYVTSSVAPVGTFIENPHSRRVVMVVASRAEDGLGHWQTLSRDVVKDYRAAFGEDPGPLEAYGVMSDSDNTGTEAEAWYGDISFSAAP